MTFRSILSSTIQTKIIRVDVSLVQSSCSSVGATTCTGSGDHPSAIPFCYTGSKLGERVNLKMNSFNSETGSFDLTGSGLESISRLGKSFSKSGQDLMADLSGCVSLAIEVFQWRLQVRRGRRGRGGVWRMTHHTPSHLILHSTHLPLDTHS